MPSSRPRIPPSCAVGDAIKVEDIAVRISLQHQFNAATVGGGFSTYQLHYPDQTT